jgi:general secretion pathway protein E
VAVHPRQEDLDARGLGTLFTPEDTLYRGQGCEHCRNTGYLGRQGVFEVVSLDAGLGQGLDAGMDVDTLRRSIRTKGIPSLFQDGMEQVRAGVTTIEEVLRVTGGTSTEG